VIKVVIAGYIVRLMIDCDLSRSSGIAQLEGNGVAAPIEVIADHELLERDLIMLLHCIHDLVLFPLDIRLRHNLLHLFIFIIIGQFITLMDLIIFILILFLFGIPFVIFLVV